MSKYEEEKDTPRHVGAVADEESSYIGSVVGSVDGASNASSNNRKNNRSSSVAVVGVPATSFSSVRATAVKSRRKNALALLGVMLLLAVVLAVVIASSDGSAEETTSSNNIVGINEQASVADAADSTTIDTAAEDDLRDESSEEFPSTVLLQSAKISGSPTSAPTGAATTTPPTAPPTGAATTTPPTASPTGAATTTPPTASPTLGALADTATNDVESLDEDPIGDSADGEGELFVEEEPIDDPIDSGGSLWDEVVDAVVDAVDYVVDMFDSLWGN